MVGCASFDATVKALVEWKCDVAVLPIENTIWGSIHEVYDLLMASEVHIVGETYERTRYCLAAPPGCGLEQVVEVVASELSLGQCQEYLKDKQWRQVASQTNSGGLAQQVAQEPSQCRAVVTVPEVAQRYGMAVLATDIQDVEDNLTRFVMLARMPQEASLASEYDRLQAVGSKTSLVFSLNNGPGVLYTALSVFSSRDVDMCKIESRPLRLSPLVRGSEEGQQFNYLFYIDCLTGVQEAGMKFALMDLADLAPQLRILGSYPTFN